MKYSIITLFIIFLVACSPYHSVDAKYIERAQKACVEFGGLKVIEYALGFTTTLCNNGYEISLKEE